MQITSFLNQDKIDAQTWNKILPIVYQRLKHMARMVKSNHKSGQTLNTTSLVHDVFLKISKHEKLSVHGTKHFYHIAAQAMRQILVDSARAKLTAKRDAEVLSLDEDIAPPEFDKNTATAHQIIDIDKALTELKKLQPRLADIVEIHFFAGYSFIEVADILNISESTVIRDWKKARAWLYATLN